MAVYVGAGNRASEYVGAQADPFPYVGAGVLFAPEVDPPSFIAATPFVSGTGAVTPTFSSTGRTANDLLVLHIESANQAVGTMPAGWHPLPSSPQGSGTGGAAGAVRCSLFGKKSTGSETTVTVPDTGDHTTAAGYVFRGVDMTMTGNLLANSNDLNNTTYWTKYMTTVTRTGTAPDGNQANRVVMTAGAPADYYIAPVAFNVLPGTTYTYTGYCRATSGTQAFGVATYFSSTDVDTILSSDEPATTTIRRFEVTFTTGSAGDISLYFCNPTSEAGFDIEFSNLQLFYGSDPIDYVATTSAPIVNWLGVNASAGTTQSATTSFSFPGVTPTIDNCLICHFVANDRDAASTSNLSSVANANLSDLTKQIDQTVTAGQGGGLAMITGIKAIAGATGNTTATNAASNTNASITLALKPADIVDVSLIGWDTSAFEAPDMTFSNDNRTVVGNDNGGTGDNRCISLASKNTGKWYVEVSIDAYEFGDVSITDTDDLNYVHFAWDGTIYSSDGGVLDTLAGYAAPCIIGLSFNTDDNLVWFRVNGGNWNGDAGSDPETNTGGYAIPVSALPYHIKVQIPYFPDSQRTLNTGSEAFSYTPPVGYSALAT